MIFYFCFPFGRTLYGRQWNHKDEDCEYRAGFVPTANNEQRVSTLAHLPLFSIDVCMAFPIVLILGMLSFVSHKSSSLVPQNYEKICYAL